MQASLKEVMHLAAALEVQSEHPLASAVINFAAEGLGFGQQRVGGIFCPSSIRGVQYKSSDATFLLTPLLEY